MSSKTFLGCKLMNIVTIAIFAIVAAILAVVLKQQKPEFSFLISVGAGIAILILTFSAASPIFTTLSDMINLTPELSIYLNVLIRALGICIVAQIAADTCRDAGENALASKVELAGKIAVLLIALPLFGEIIRVAQNLLH